MANIIKIQKEEMKSMINLCETKHWTDYVRILDLAETDNAKWGSSCLMQIMDYGTGDWIDCAPNGKQVNSMLKLATFIRTDLEYQGAIRLAIAGN